jgi:hypothetical protein
MILQHRRYRALRVFCNSLNTESMTENLNITEGAPDATDQGMDTPTAELDGQPDEKRALILDPLCMSRLTAV